MRAGRSVVKPDVSIVGVYLIALTGGIASGKTAVASRLEELGAVRIDADALARDVVAAGTPALAAIAAHFGPAVIGADGTLDRPALGAIIFSDEPSRLALNAITHPAIQALTARLFADAAVANPAAIVVYDVPLLVESPEALGRHRFDLIVVVTAHEEVRIARLVEIRGLTHEDAVRRLRSQGTDAQRSAIADVIIDSNGTLEQTLQQADELWRTLPRR